MIKIGVDLFAEFKEHYGQPAAEYCLRQVSRALVKSVKRETDYFAVCGKGEFILLLPETDASGALKVARRFQDALEELKIADEGVSRFNAAQIAVSMGMATVIPTSKQSADNLIQEAEALLREARRDMNNQIYYLALLTA